MDFIEIYMPINTIQIEFVNGGYASIWAGVIALGRSQKWKMVSG